MHPRVISVIERRRSCCRPPLPPASAAPHPLAAVLAHLDPAYTGKFTVDGDKITSPVDISWNEVNTGRNQTRFFKMEGENLVIQTPEQASVLEPGKRVTSTRTWERER